MRPRPDYASSARSTWRPRRTRSRIAIALPRPRAGVAALPAQRTDGPDPSPNGLPANEMLAGFPWGRLQVTRMHLIKG